MADLTVTWYPDGWIMVRSPRGFAQLEPTRMERWQRWQAEAFAHLLGAEFRVFGDEDA